MAASLSRTHARVRACVSACALSVYVRMYVFSDLEPKGKERGRAGRKAELGLGSLGP
jgi:hypothetical protein